ncbi:MAG: GT-D fold domain-containing glycosyltransferase [Dethiobacteria bacterium]|jgi:hypothetical protein
MFFKLDSGRLMDFILNALEQRLPCSIVSVGATESFVLAQYKVLSEKEFMSHPEARVANLGVKRGQLHRGITFPNIKARDAGVNALRKADIVGYNILIKDMHSGLLTEKVFAAYRIKPKYIFEAYLRRVIMFSQREKFMRMLYKRRILLICGYAAELAAALERKWKPFLNFEIAGTIKIHSFENIPRVKKELDKYDFDLCLLAAGINAVILAVYIAEKYGKVAFDLGQGMESLISGKVVDEGGFLEKTIGIQRLMSM